MDTDTLQIAETVQLNQDMYAIGYCESRDQYVVGISGTFNFMILDGQLNKVAYYYGKDTGLVKQGVDCDDKYIYFPQNNKDCTVNQIVIYDWDGNYINTVRVGLLPGDRGCVPCGRRSVHRLQCQRIVCVSGQAGRNQAIMNWRLNRMKKRLLPV